MEFDILALLARNAGRVVERDELVPQLVDALEKLETSHPDSAEERDAMSQIYRVQRRARR